MRFAPALAFCLVSALLAIEIGEDSPNESIRQEFRRAALRNGFHILVREPATKVRKLGATGLAQEFVDINNNDGSDTLPHYALVRANATDPIVEGVETVFQIYPRVFSFYSSVGANTAGYPVNDSAVCTVGANPCLYQVFDRNYALFAYAQTTPEGQNFSVRDPIFTRWRTLGIAQLGPAVAGEETIASGAGTGVTAVGQRFHTGAIYNITSGILNGRVFAVRSPIFDTYTAQGRHGGFLGLPSADESAQPNGRRRQTFEGGAIEYELGGVPVLLLPVSSIAVSAASPIERLTPGSSFVLTASLFAANGASLDGRAVTWTTSNGRVLAIEPSGASVTVRAVGGGSATITAFSEGRSSRGLTFFVTAPCCQVGEGAPTAAVQQSFQDAVTRNRLTVRVPAASPVQRVAGGYVQELASSDGSVRYLLARSDARPTTYVVTGAILTRYLALGGAAGALGFPAGDASPRGRQVFDGGALAGDPAVAVSGPILTRWAAQNYETGPSGLPVSESRAVLSFAATAGAVQEFTGGLIAASLNGPLANRAFLVAGPILARYRSLNGAAGRLGLPASEEGAASGRRRQEFEGGAIDFTPGDTEASASERERRPRIFANPPTVPAGSRIRLAAGGFDPGATLRVSISGRPDFLVETETGAYVWDAYVAPGTPSGLVTLRAADTGGAGLAVGSYVVQAAAETLVQIAKLGGDLQTGPPGARLPVPLRIAVRDESGSPLAGLPVRFTPSPGARIEEASAVTDDKGEAQAWLRLPMSELPALATAEAGRQVVTFSTRAQAATLANFPRLTQNVDGAFGGGGTIARNGAMLAASASILRYLQNRGEAPSANGPADVERLNAFLRELCVFDFRGERICDGFVAPPGAGARNVNLWRLAAFAGGNVEVTPVATVAPSIRDRIAAGSPVLLAVTVLPATGDTALGSHFAVAIGVTANGGIAIHDPNPAIGRTSLEELTGGFQVSGRAYRGEVTSAVALLPRAPSTQAFLVASSPPLGLAAAGGACGAELRWLDVPAALEAPARAPQAVRYVYCDGLAPVYQLDLSGEGRASLTDLADPGAFAAISSESASAWRVRRDSSHWMAEPLTAGLAAPAPVRNAATFGPELSPGVLAAIFGSGLARADGETAVELDGVPARVLAATPFQVNAELPATAGPGLHTLTVRSPAGETRGEIVLDPVSPAIFQLGAGRAAVLNQNGEINSPVRPASRGQAIVVYCTGLGETARQGGLAVTALPVRGAIEGRALTTEFAGPAPGLAGVYQVNLRLPTDLPPGLDLRLRLEAGGVASAPALVAIE